MPESFALAGCPPVVTVEAAYSKHKKRDVQPLPRGLTEALGPWLEGKATARPVFTSESKGVVRRLTSDMTAKMIRVDLAAAGIPYVTAEGVGDVHALRHGFVTRLVQTGVNVKLCQELARHSDPKLTLGVYAHVTMRDMATALTMLPALEAPTSTALRTAHATHGEPCHGLPQGHGGAESEADESESETPGRARIADPGVSCDGGGRGIRTLNLRVMNPPL